MPYKNKQKRREAQKRWREKNKDKLKELKSRDYRKNKHRRDKSSANYRKAHPWVAHYVNAKQRCNNPNNTSYKWYGAKGVKFELTMEEIKELWFRDRANKMDRPSIDRKDSSLNYTFDNCRFVELKINVSKKVDSK